MPLRSDWSEATCPIARSLDVVGDPWVLLVLREALQGVSRYDDFRDRLGVADSVLAKRLAAMVDAGLLERTPYRDGRRTRAGYALTDAGADLLPVLNALVLWGERHRPRATGVMHVVHETCGAETVSADTCSSCGEPLAPDTVAWRKPRDPDRLVPLVPR